MHSSSSPTVYCISRCTVKPAPSGRQAAATLHHLTPWDLAMLSTHYIQKGLLFSTSLTTDHIVDRLKSSLSVALRHLYPLAGRLTTHQHPNGISISVDCTDQGAEFIHAVADNVTVADVLAPLSDVPSFLRSFFPLAGAVSHDGHSLPLLSVQLTKLHDGVFLACSFNHALGDGTSYWHFFSVWAEIARSDKYDTNIISRTPVLDRWLIDPTIDPLIILPFYQPDEFIERLTSPPLRERIFHFSPESMAALKKTANQESGKLEISSFQTLSAHVWISITRARGLPATQKTSCRLAAQNRSRIKPPLPNEYFGNSLSAVSVTLATGELLAGGLGAAAWALNRAVVAHDDVVIRRALRAWHESPLIYGMSMFDGNSVMMGGSPRFDMYGCDFGLGKAVATRSGGANKFDGKVSAYPGREGQGSVDLEVCLKPEYMKALETDAEFMAVVSATPKVHI